MDFSDFHLAPELEASVRHVGFEKPTQIQAQAIPPGMAGGDILASAETGSGKTAAFLLPIMNRLLPMQRGATRALVLAPTRELAAQTAESFRELAAGTRLTCAAVFGGVSMGAQERAFKSGVDMIVACPGRLLDHMKEEYADMSWLRFLVLDEADRMLDMGFLPDIKRVLARLPKERQTFFFSATLPPDIVALSRGMLRDPVRINVGRAPAPAHGVSQTVYAVASDRKAPLMLELLTGVAKGSVLVFTRTKHRANRLADFLDKHGVACARIHGNRSQSQRTHALSGFKHGQFRVLVATDIAARGIDVESLGAVVNFDVPHMPEDYIHRVGRTARADAVGDAFTLVSPEEETDFSEIERALGKKIPRQKIQGFDYTSTPRAAAQLEVTQQRRAQSSQGGRPQGTQGGRPQGTQSRRPQPTQGGRPQSSQDGRRQPSQDGRRQPSQDGRRQPSQDGRRQSSQDGRRQPTQGRRQRPAQGASRPRQNRLTQNDAPRGRRA